MPWKKIKIKNMENEQRNFDLISGINSHWFVMSNDYTITTFFPLDDDSCFSAKNW